MTHIIVMEIENNAEFIQDIIKLITEKSQCHYTQLCSELSANRKEEISFPGLIINLEKYIVTRNNQPVSMSSYEFRALSHLAKQPGRVFTKEQLYEIVYGDEKAVNVDNTVYCLICEIRKKLKSGFNNHEYIQTVRGVGYKFIIPEE